MIELLLAFALLINAERPVDLKPDATLTVRAYVRAYELCEKNQFSHDGWVKSFEGLKHDGPNYMGENLAKGFNSPSEAHKALMASPTHKANIEKPEYTKLGVAEGSCGVTVFLFSN